jgi:uncharacterized membrane protein
MYKVFLIFILFVILDLFYLNFYKTFYEKHLNIQYSNIKIIPAILAWLFIVIAYYFSVQEPFENKYLRGLILAIGMYGVYNMTNLAILTSYSYELAIQDCIWGASLITIVTYVYSLTHIEYKDRFGANTFYN